MFSVAALSFLGFERFAQADPYKNCQWECDHKWGPGYIGNVQGTAPFCDADCSDCAPEEECGPTFPFFDDGGHECQTGNKQCCCRKRLSETLGLAVKETLAMASATNSCDSFCTSKWGPKSDGYVMGTAPFCSGDATDCHEHDYVGPLQPDFPDGGHECLTGSKQCCCTRPSDMTDLFVEAVASAQSCDAFCTSQDIRYGYVRGTAPFCGAGPGDCCDHDYPGPQASSFSDGGDACWSGSKICCCGTPAGQSGCPKPGLGDLSCNIIKGVCDIIAGKATSSAYDCGLLSIDGAGFCEVVGCGPLDPWANICAGVVAGAIEYACTQAIKEAGKFGASECREAAGCGTSAILSNNQTTPNSPIVI